MRQTAHLAAPAGAALFAAQFDIEGDFGMADRASGRNDWVIPRRRIRSPFAACGQVSAHRIHSRVKLAQIACADRILADMVVLRVHGRTEIYDMK